MKNDILYDKDLVISLENLKKGLLKIVHDSVHCGIRSIQKQN